jgi:ATP phosphoribosyltransferase regulatory subunit
VFDALQRKSQPDLQHILRDSDGALVARLQGLMDLHGGSNTVALARQQLADIPEAIEAIEQIDRVVSYVQANHPEVSVYIDLTELRGFRYHTGLVFAAYVSGVGNAIAKGGRYDNVGSVFGRERPATGFTCDLKALAEQCATNPDPGGVISAPVVEDAALNDAILALRTQGRVVVNALEGIHDPRCTEQLIKEGDHWVCQPLA